MIGLPTELHVPKRPPSLIQAVAAENAAEVLRLAKTKRVLNGHVNYTDNTRIAASTGEPLPPIVLEQWTPLHESVRSVRALSPSPPAMLKLLLDHGAKADIQDIDGETPLFVASNSGKARCVQVLFKPAPILIFVPMMDLVVGWWQLVW
jgi:hypothetical protein